MAPPSLKTLFDGGAAFSAKKAIDNDKYNEFRKKPDGVKPRRRCSDERPQKELYAWFVAGAPLATRCTQNFTRWKLKNFPCPRFVLGLRQHDRRHPHPREERGVCGLQQGLRGTS